MCHDANVLAGLLVAVLSQAPAPRASLTFSSESPACTEAALREAVAWRLEGLDPFGSGGRVGVDVKVVGSERLHASVTLLKAGAPPATRVLSGAADCQAVLGEVAALLEPELRQVDPAPVVAAPRFSVTAAAGGDLGQQPDGIVSARAGVRAGGPRFTGLVEAVLTLPSRLWLDDGSFVAAAFYGANLGGCVGGAIAHGCVILRGGAVRLQPAGVAAMWAPSFSAGLRGAVEWPKASPVAVYGALELRVPLGRLSLYVDDELWWRQNWLIGSLQAGLVVRIP